MEEEDRENLRKKKSQGNLGLSASSERLHRHLFAL